MTVRPRCSRGAAIVHMKVSCHPADKALPRLATVVSIAASALKGAMMTETVAVAANDESVRPVNGSIRAGELGIEVPKGHIGPVLLSETGRTIWWTGRVAIGLRYQRPRYSESYGQSALWLQDVLLGCSQK